ncbi:FmtB-protein [Staphylococcus aureus]|uniref:FmtB-protein n=1 Tax=Staphylococcus aureus TaxID=1280 RepID=A0A380DUN8_STAAU|nr:FmtB-protein [Staphylococcus aureus]
MRWLEQVMFEAGSNRTYQAQGNVLALGRISGTDASNHGDFNGIGKIFNSKSKF